MMVNLVSPISVAILSARMVANEHFGGFLTKKNEKEGEQGGNTKSWKERMEEIIAKSKKEKVWISYCNKI